MFSGLYCQSEMPAVTKLLQDRRVIKASADDSSHPGWPAGTSGGRGGRFRPKTEAVNDADWLAIDDDNAAGRSVRRQFRRELVNRIRPSPDMTPIVGDKMALPRGYLSLDDIAQMIMGYEDLRVDARAAIDFAKKAPYRLEDLRVSDAEEGFATYYQFYKDGCLKRYGSAGPGYHYHHLVEQSNEGIVDPYFLHSTANIVRLPALFHEATYEFYSQNSRGKGSPIMREILKNESLPTKIQFGSRVMEALGLTGKKR